MSDALTALVARLQASGADPAAGELADALWLSRWSAPTSALGGRCRAGADTRPRATAPGALNEPPRTPGAGAVAGPPPAAADRPPGSATESLLYAVGPRPAGEKGAREPDGRPLPVRVPVASALPGLLPLQQALRPLKHYGPPARTTAWEIDEDETAERAAQTGHLIPVYREADQPTASIQLLMDTSSSMAPWEQMLEELRQVCAGSGAFRNVLVHYVHETEAGEPAVSSSPRHYHRRGSRADRLGDPTGRRILLVLSDCAGPLWRSGQLQRTLHRWARTAPVAVVQPLPQRLWRRTHLPAVPGRLHRTEGPGGHLQFRPASRGFASAGNRAADRPVAVPVLSPTQAALGAWGRLMSGATGLSLNAAAGWVLPAHEASGGPRQTAVHLPDTLVKGFLSVASPDAAQLAVLLSAAPLALPVMQLVQRAMLAHTTPAVLAEVLLSGLLVRLPQTRGADAGESHGGPWYEFHDGVRDTLLERLSENEAELVLTQCSQYVERHFGRGARNFPALAAAYLSGAVDPSVEPPAPKEQGHAVPQAFARVPQQVLRRYLPPRTSADPMSTTRSPTSSEAAPEEAGQQYERAQRHVGRFHEKGTVRDLDEAIRLLRDVTGTEAPLDSRALWSRALADALFEQWHAQGAWEDLRSAHAAARTAVVLSESRAVREGLRGLAELTLGRILTALADEVGRAEEWTNSLPGEFVGPGFADDRGTAVHTLLSTSDELLARALEHARRDSDAFPDVLVREAAHWRVSVIFRLASAYAHVLQEPARSDTFDEREYATILQRGIDTLDVVAGLGPTGSAPTAVMQGRLRTLQAVHSTGRWRHEHAERAVHTLTAALQSAEVSAWDAESLCRAWLDLAGALQLTAAYADGPDHTTMARLLHATARAWDLSAALPELRKQTLSIIGEAFYRQFRHTGENAALDGAVDAWTSLRAAGPLDDEEDANLSALLGEALLERAVLRAETAAATLAIRILRESVDGTVDEGLLAERRLLLGRALLQRFAVRGRRTDLAEAEWVIGESARGAGSPRTTADAWLGLASLTAEPEADELSFEARDRAASYLLRAVDAAHGASDPALVAEALSRRAAVLEPSVGPRNALRLYRSAWEGWQQADSAEDPSAQHVLRRIRALEGPDAS